MNGIQGAKAVVEECGNHLDFVKVDGRYIFASLAGPIDSMITVNAHDLFF
jgi:hypothetical protein